MKKLYGNTPIRFDLFQKDYRVNRGERVMIKLTFSSLVSRLSVARKPQPSPAFQLSRLTRQKRARERRNSRLHWVRIGPLRCLWPPAATPITPTRCWDLSRFLRRAATIDGEHFYEHGHTPLGLWADREKGKKKFFEKSQDSGELFAFLVSRSSESETKP